MVSIFIRRENMAIKTKISFLLFVFLIGIFGCSKSPVSEKEEAKKEVEKKRSEEVSSKKDIVSLEATIVMKIGKVKVYKSSDGKWENAYVGMKLREADSIKVFKNSSATLKTNSNSIIKLSENTVFALSDFRKVNGKEVNRFDLKLGKVILRPRKLRPGEVFEVQTPTAVAGVRGTIFLVEADKKENTKIAVLEGIVYTKRRVSLKDIKADKELIEKLQDKIASDVVVIEENQFVEVKKKDLDRITEELKKAIEQKKLTLENIDLADKVIKSIKVEKKLFGADVMKDFEEFTSEFKDVIGEIKIEKEEELVVSVSRNRWEKQLLGGVVGSDVYYNGVVYVVSQKGMIYGFDSDGKKVFEKKIANSIMSSPVVCKGILYVVSTDGYLYAVSLREEKVLWRVYTGSLIYGAKPVVINGDGIYVASSKGQLVKVAFDGRKIWVFGVEGSIVGETPAYHNGKIFFGTEDNRVYAVDTKTGREIWLQKVKARIVASSPLIVRGKLYIGDFAGYIYAMRLKDGKIVWKKQLNGKIVSSPVSYKNNIIVGTTKGIVYAMKLDDGSLIWKRELATRIEVSPKVWKGKLVVPAGNLLYVLSLKTGNIFWKHKIKTKITTSPMIMKTGDNEIIFIGDADGNLYALNSMLKIKKTKSF